MAIIKAGTYRFNDVLTPCDAMVSNSTHFNFAFTLLEPTEESTARAYEYIAPYIEQAENGELSEEELELVMMEFYRISLENATEIEAIGTAIGMDGGYSLEYGYIVDEEETGRYVYGPEEGWKTYLLGEGIQTITIPNDSEVSEEFEPWFTANTKRLSTITYNGSTIASLLHGQTATLKCAGMKMESDVVVEVAELPEGGGSNANIVPLTVTENGVYDAPYAVGTEMWDESTVYDDVLSVDGVSLHYKKAANLTVPDDVSTLNNPEYCVKFGYPDGREQVLPFSDIGIASANGVYMSSYLSYAVIWIKDATTVNAAYGASFEDNTVYISDFLWLVSDMAGVSITITAQGEKADSYFPVNVDVPVPSGYIKPSGERSITENGTYNVWSYEYVNVNIDKVVEELPEYDGSMEVV